MGQTYIGGENNRFEMWMNGDFDLCLHKRLWGFCTNGVFSGHMAFVLMLKTSSGNKKTC